jgi:hypothetical protein
VDVVRVDVAFTKTVIWSTMTNNESENQAPWFLFRKRTIPTEQAPLVAEVSANSCGYRGWLGERNGSPWPLISCILDRSRYFSFK